MRAASVLVRWMPLATGLVAQASMYSAMCGLLQGARVSWQARAVLLLIGQLALIVALTIPRWRITPLRWLVIALHAGLFGAIFWGANEALDALYGAQRAKATTAAAFGGVELWFVCCPVIVSIALAGWLSSLLSFLLSPLLSSLLSARLRRTHRRRP